MPGRILGVAVWVVASAAVLGNGPQAASAATPAQYRAHLNALCRTYTPRFKAVETGIGKAQGAEDPISYYAGLREFFTLVLDEDSSVEQAVPPKQLKSRMAHPVSLLKSVDPTLRAGVVAAGRGDAAGVSKTVNKMNSVANSINTALDGVGLRDCGSNQ